MKMRGKDDVVPTEDNFSANSHPIFKRDTLKISIEKWGNIFQIDRNRIEKILTPHAPIIEATPSPRPCRRRDYTDREEQGARPV